MTTATTTAQPGQGQGEPLQLPRLRLTVRELEVLFWLVQEHADYQIAMKLNIEVDTVRKHITSARSKLGLNGRTGLVIWYVRSYGFPPYS